MEESGAYTTLLHNMSAPSRMQVTVRPLAEMDAASQHVKTPIQKGGYQGLTLYTVLNLHRLFVDGFKGYPGSIPKYYSGVNNTHTSLSMLTELALARIRGKNGPVRILKEWVDRSPEDIEERFISLCKEIDTGGFALPVFALVKPLVGKVLSTGVTPDPLHFVSIFCRISGHLFMAGRNPLIPESIPVRKDLGIYRINSSHGD